MVVGHVASVGGLELGPLGLGERGSGWCLEERRRRVEGSGVRVRKSSSAEDPITCPAYLRDCVGLSRPPAVSPDSQKKGLLSTNPPLLFIYLFIFFYSTGL